MLFRSLSTFDGYQRGVTTLDVVRANKFVFEATGAPVDSINVWGCQGEQTTLLHPLDGCHRADKLFFGTLVEACDWRTRRQVSLAAFLTGQVLAEEFEKGTRGIRVFFRVKD